MMQFVDRPKITSKKQLLELLWVAKANYAEVGRLAGLSRERVRQLVARITPEELEEFNEQKALEAKTKKLETVRPALSAAA